MTKLSSAQYKALELIAAASDAGAAYMPPRGPRGRPSKFLKDSGLATHGGQHTGFLFITDAGRAALARVKGTPA